MCKCQARTFEGHLRKCRSGYPGHVYTGPLGMPDMGRPVRTPAK